MRTVSISRHRRELERKCDKFSRRVRNAKQNEQSYQNGISRVDCVRAVLSLALQKSAFGQNAPYPWPAVIGLTYIPLAVVLLVFVHKRMYRKELAASQTSGYVGVRAPASLPAVAWISSLDHLQRFVTYLGTANGLGFCPRVFPR